MRQLTVGDPAPALQLTATDGTPVTLASFTGRRVILYFYPKAFTPGCTTQACDFRDNLASLQGAGYVVLGISDDDPETLKNFAAEESLPFTLLSDPGSATAKAWGAWGDKVLPDGREIVGVLRSTFAFDEQGTLLAANYNVPAEGSVAMLRDQLGI